MNINDAYFSRWLKADNLTDGPVIATITQFEMVTLKTEEGEEKRPALFFEETAQGLILNRTNASMVAAVLKSPHTEQWLGKQIGLRSEMVPFKGKAVPAIRVFDPAPAHVGGFGKKADDLPEKWDGNGQPISASPTGMSDELIPDPGLPISEKKRKSA